MKVRVVGLSLSLAALGLALCATEAKAFSIGGHLNGEREFGALDREIAWAAESRIGVAGAADYEIDIHNSDWSIVPHQEFDWVNGEEVSFKLEFTGSQLIYTVGDSVTVDRNVTQDNFSELFIRTTARLDGSSVVVKDLMLSDAAMSSTLGVTSEFACNNPSGCGYYDSSQYLHITDVSGAFTLTGTSIFSWDEAKVPTRSRLAYQIKLVEGMPSDTPSVPEPTSALALGLVAGTAARLKHRQRHHSNS
ncbi:MAG: PEP-CTERM sorting domain-containing protein [Cyanobacteria bacterium SID2]|nr:PEP-CTERM sorting domain-containing protein [Cyanobacteria bacterium SID2]MBP0003976.1 PEP-CTERM sorting domain-containing protein [Cyanobacteria bacterium SBC]